MQFVIVHNGNVIFGPKNWSKRRFEEVLLEDLELEAELPSTSDAMYEVNEDTLIYPVIDQPLPEYNTKIERLNGPYYTFTEDDIAERYFVAQPLDLEIAKNNLKEVVTNLRYEREVGGFQHQIGELTVTIDTTRDGRRIFIETYSMLGDEETVNWKFPEAWLMISKADLGGILYVGKNHIQDAFNWELNLHNIIGSVNSLSELDEIDLS